MSFDPKIYRNSKDGIGGPGDPVAANSTDDNTLVSLAKKLVAQLAGTLTVTPSAGAATSANQVLEIAGLTAIDGHVDGLETTSTAILAKIISAPATEAKQDAAIVQETAINSVLGTTSGAAVTTSVAGTIQGYLRGIVSLLVSGITVATHAVTQSGTWTVQPGNTANTTAWKVDGSAVTQPVSIATAPALVAGTALIGRAVADASAATGGIASTSRILSATASANPTSAKTSAGRVYAIQGYNAAATVRYLKLYNKASAPSVGTDVPIKTLALPPSCGFAFDWPLGYSFATGIAYALTVGSSDGDATALTAGDVLGLNLDYV